MSDREKFLKERMRGVGGSDVDDVLSLEPYGCRRRLWYEKSGVKADFELSNDHILRGIALEGMVVEIFKEKTGLRVERVQEAFFDEKNHMLVHVDGLIEEAGECGVLEIKVPSREGYQAVKRTGMPKGYILQLQHGMAVTGARFGYFAVHCCDVWSKPLIWRVDADVELQEMIRLECREFWQSVESEQIPQRLDVKDPRCKKCQYRDTCQGEYLDNLLEDANVVDRDESLGDLLAQILDAKQAERDAGEYVEFLEKQLKDLLGDRQVVDAPGARVYFKAGERVTPYNADALKARREDLIAMSKHLPEEHWPLHHAIQEILTPRVTKTRTLRVYPRGK